MSALEVADLRLTESHKTREIGLRQTAALSSRLRVPAEVGGDRLGLPASGHDCRWSPDPSHIDAIIAEPALPTFIAA